MLAGLRAIALPHFKDDNNGSVCACCGATAGELAPPPGARHVCLAHRPRHSKHIIYGSVSIIERAQRSVRERELESGGAEDRER